MTERGRPEEEPEDEEHPFYRLVEPGALWAKAILQALVGLATLAYIVDRLLVTRRWFDNIPNDGKTAITAAGVGLAVATAVELAYTLFTDGPDEAVVPLLLGVSAYGLIEVSKEPKLTPSNMGALVLVALTIALLFEINRRYKPKRKRKK